MQTCTHSLSAANTLGKQGIAFSKLPLQSRACSTHKIRQVRVLPDKGGDLQGQDLQTDVLKRRNLAVGGIISYGLITCGLASAADAASNRVRI